MKIGSEYSALGMEEGIHWHIHRGVKVEYISEFPDRQTIPFVRYSNLETGDTIIYLDEENPPGDELLSSGELRTMDCMDCHNRPSHEFVSPQFFIDNALTYGSVPKELPDIKQIAMENLYAHYTNTDSAILVMEENIREYYSFMYPEMYENRPELIERAIKGIQTQYSNNMFPEMRAQWDQYPNHIGHIEFNGCFRCHDDKHKSSTGKVISKDCNMCHTIIAQGTPGSLELVSVKDSLEFHHPVDIGDSWKEFNCAECHLYLYQ